MERRVLLAAILSAFFLAVYSHLLPSAYRPHVVGEKVVPGRDEAPQGAVSLPVHAEGIEETASLATDDIELRVGTSSGDLKAIVLKRFKGEDASTLAFGSAHPLVTVLDGGTRIDWLEEGSTERTVRLRGDSRDGAGLSLSYSIEAQGHVVRMELSSTRSEAGGSGAAIQVVHSFELAEARSSPTGQVEVVTLSGAGPAGKYKRFGPSKSIRNVPRGTFMGSIAERYFCHAARWSVEMGGEIVTGPDSKSMGIAVTPEVGGALRYEAEIYLGPKDYFYMKRNGFDRAFKLGMLGQIGLILLMFLGFIAKLTGSYGVAIILMSGIITSAMAPLTLIGMRSMKKMQDLKPQIDRLMREHKGDASKANKEVMELYKQHRVSPMGGCLPMLLPFPIFIALFRGFTQFIDLRGKGFLWIKDLSQGDRLVELPVVLPMIGRDVNILPIAMAVAMHAQTRMSRGGAQVDKSNPMAAAMSGPLMSIVFGLMFYHMPAALVLYWFSNTLVSMAWYRVGR